MEGFKERYERECRRSGVVPAVAVQRLIEKVSPRTGILFHFHLSTAALDMVRHSRLCVCFAGRF
jgi:hypothetical protein